MGHYGAGTTCQLCGENHPTRTDAVACSDIVWRGHSPFTSDVPDTLPDDIALLLCSAD
jgi:hypothetical protein